MGWLQAILTQRCPRCRTGKLFRGLIDMRERCPTCDLVFEREHGYFTGSMVVGYVLSVPALVAITAAILFATGCPLG